MRGLDTLSPIAIVKLDSRTDYVFLRKSDLQKDYPENAHVSVVAVGGVKIAIKSPGSKKLTVAENIDIDNFFRE